MQFIRPKVSTLCIGQAASMGSLLLAAGRGRHALSRFPMRRIMVHQPSGGFQGQASDIVRHAEDIMKVKRRLNEIYVRHTGRDYDTIERTLDRDHFMSAEEAKDFGIVDQVIDKRPEEPTQRNPMLPAGFPKRSRTAPTLGWQTSETLCVREVDGCARAFTAQAGVGRNCRSSYVDMSQDRASRIGSGDRSL